MTELIFIWLSCLRKNRPRGPKCDLKTPIFSWPQSPKSSSLERICRNQFKLYSYCRRSVAQRTGASNEVTTHSWSSRDRWQKKNMFQYVTLDEKPGAKFSANLWHHHNIARFRSQRSQLRHLKESIQSIQSRDGQQRGKFKHSIRILVLPDFKRSWPIFGHSREWHSPFLLCAISR